MQKYTQLTYEQGYHIYLLNKQVYNQTFIAKSMGRNKSTISREFKILKPLIEIISALGNTGFYKRPPHIPHIPIFGETLIAHFMADDATIKRKKRWP